MSNSGSTGSPSVFISYAHESARHRDHVIEFASFLHEQGVVAVLDAWLGSARQDWYAWALREMTAADYVIVVASERYRWIAEGHGSNQHKGVRSEAAVLRELIYADRERWLPRILPVLLPGHDNSEIPLFLQPYSASFFAVTGFTAAGAQQLLRVLHRKPAHLAPPVAGGPPELPVLPNAPAASSTPVPVPRQLPMAVRDFVGRTGPLTALDAATDASAARVVVVDGAAGAGKTTLAVHWGHTRQDSFPDGTLFVNLRGYGPNTPLEPACVLVSFLHALGVTEERMPAEPEALAGLYRSLVAGRRMLMVLDNAASADQVRPLLPGAPGCVTVVTSRAALTSLVVAEAAHRVALDLLTPREAVALVAEIVGADRVAAEPDATGELVRLCSGVPLAVRVAASRVAMRRHTTLSDLADDLARPAARLDVLSGADDSTAVRVVLDWSYERLSSDQALCYRRLGLHPVPEFGLRGAAALTGLDLDHAHRRLEELAEVHLLEPVGRTRYRFHDLLHVHAAERAASDDTAADRHRALTAMVTWYAQAAAGADRLVFPGQPALPAPPGAPVAPASRDEAWSWLVAECDALLAALQYADDHDLTAATIALAAAMRFLALRPSVTWGSRLAAETRGLRTARATGDLPAEVALCGSRADTFQMLADWSASDADLARLAELAEELDDPALRAEALCGMGRNRKLQHRDAEARRYYQRALPLVRGTGAVRVEAVVRCNLGQLSARLGRHRDAIEHARRELALRRTCGDTVGEAYALHNMAVAHQRMGDHHAAIEIGARAEALYRATAASERFLADVLETTAVSLEHTGDQASARRYLHEAATILGAYNDPHAENLSARAAGAQLAPVVGDVPPAASVAVR
jgi:tetratricopeptide (TPR) repeat protein